METGNLVVFFISKISWRLHPPEALPEYRASTCTNQLRSCRMPTWNPAILTEPSRTSVSFSYSKLPPYTTRVAQPPRLCILLCIFKSGAQALSATFFIDENIFSTVGVNHVRRESCLGPDSSDFRFNVIFLSLVISNSVSEARVFFSARVGVRDLLFSR